MEHLHPNDDYLRQLHKFCPGCGNGIILHTLIRTIKKSIAKEEGQKTITQTKNKNPLDNYIFLSGIGCSGWIVSPHLNADTFHTTHGRAIAIATGVKVANPKLNVIVLSGDGDLASIGGNHLIHAARRNVEMLCILVNNFIFGMTGGQCGPTTFHDAITSTTPYGNFEYPFRIAEVISAAGAAYSARWTVRHVIQLEKSFETALKRSKDGFAFIEVLSPCTTQFQKRNFKSEDPKLLFEYFKENSIYLKDKEKFSNKELKNKFILGEFSNEKMIGLTKTIETNIIRACSKNQSRDSNGGK
jgi:2-oxoglutarate ferredoxin oxidoreductase subunit beta